MVTPKDELGILYTVLVGNNAMLNQGILLSHSSPIFCRASLGTCVNRYHATKEVTTNTGEYVEKIAEIVLCTIESPKLARQGCLCTDLDQAKTHLMGDVRRARARLLQRLPGW